MGLAIGARLRNRAMSLTRPRQSETLPALLDRRRIYILPTRFGLFMAAMLGTMLLGGLNYNNNPALLLGFLLAATAQLSLHATHLALSGISLRDARAMPVFAGEDLQLDLRFDATRARPRTGLVIECGTVRTVFSMLDAEALEVALTLPTAARGWLSPGRIKISTTQPMGLARAWSYFWPELRLLVYPALEIHAPPLPTNDSRGTHARVRAQGEEPHHLRDYRIGDPPRQVAWKASARIAMLLVREYEAHSDRDVRLVWDTLGNLAYEARIARLARWVVDADRSNARYALVLPSKTLGPAQGHAHRHACLQEPALMPHG